MYRGEIKHQNYICFSQKNKKMGSMHADVCCLNFDFKNNLEVLS